MGNTKLYVQKKLDTMQQNSKSFWLNNPIETKKFIISIQRNTKMYLDLERNSLPKLRNQNQLVPLMKRLAQMLMLNQPFTTKRNAHK